MDGGEGGGASLIALSCSFHCEVMRRAQASYDLFLRISGLGVVSLGSYMSESCVVVFDCKFLSLDTYFQVLWLWMGVRNEGGWFN